MRKIRVLVVLPILKNPALEEVTRKEIEQIRDETLEVNLVSLEQGPASIESEFDDRIASPWVLEKVKEAEVNGFDAVFLDCMGDIALNAAREIVRIPVIGPCQATMAIASMLGDRFSVITILENVVPLFWRKAREYGFIQNLASVRSVEVPVLELDTKRELVKKKLAEESKIAIEKDGADVIILGCTGMVGMARDVQEVVGVPVIDPVPVSIKLAKLMAELRLIHSNKAYPKPPSKLRKFPGVSELLFKGL
ncbi:MAG: AroM family protein [Thaumarchaeota archaeon]|jgi:allantoin racemase|nr:AroM family protein [Candidatus Terraquivivens yellowstonensis]MCL7387933.1 AroM family protein [Candidatus Terraquivivens yellowstonensis]MCL7393034.1 AroM family protein [Candidatus Terraquivivens yellowstonensis]MCL7395601.1 AroM family protein [Candidatus Terraquivivens yellowstonensis]MCL7398356.1 AroM family protein [Candidatus Terraquivivens yellowstonensis]